MKDNKLSPILANDVRVSLTDSSRSIFQADDTRQMKIMQTIPHHRRDRRNQVHGQILAFGVVRPIVVIVNARDIQSVIIKQENRALDLGIDNVNR